MVVLFHAYQGFNWNAIGGNYWGPVLRAISYQGAYGVHLFFLLSGFLIGTALLRSRAKDNYYKNFYIKRFLRILPVYLVMIVVLKIWKPVSWNFVLASTLFMTNYARLFGAHLYEYGSLWSLAVEEHFYLLWPTFVRRLQNQALVRLLVCIIVAEPILRVIGTNISSSIDVASKTMFVLDNIAYGALVATLLHMRKITSANVGSLGVTLLAVSTPLVLLMLWMAAFHSSPTIIALRSVPWLWMCTGALLLGIKRDSRLPSTPSAHRPRGVLPFLGYISYGLYLVNQFINEKLGAVVNRTVLVGAQGSLRVFTGRALICITVAIAVAYLSRRYFEAPMLALKDRLVGHPELQAEEARVPSAQVISSP